ncbi:hypothetical protein GCM10017784_30430 [Deinococcus indicus]|uniref:hypothetical protein n=1 Tax=Deinococcus indicus TaxID=223556 RepID=UPI00174C3BC4|nr:hypothetical protein [Deinococcus indicus]GHG34518.1 hypothetical protein GCM10017784_30430 [Deinococcus indicus]
MKRELDVTAFRTLTEYDKKGTLTSTIELRVPAHELEYLSEVLAAQDNDQDVRSTLIVRPQDDSAPRRLPLTLKNSKMRDFVPVAVFTKYGDARDNLTELFSTGRHGRFDLLLVVEVVEECEQKGLDFEAAPGTPTWVLDELQQDDLALERMLGEGCPHCPDVRMPGNEAYDRVAAQVAQADRAGVYTLLQLIQIDPSDWDDHTTTPEEDLISMRGTLLFHWQAVAAALNPVPPRPVLTPREPGEDLPFPIDEEADAFPLLGLN